MITKIEFGKNKDVTEVAFGSGTVGMTGIMFPDMMEKYCLGLRQTEPHKIGEIDPSIIGKDTDEIEPIGCVLSFTKPESVAALIHSLIELQKRMFDKDQETVNPL